MRLKFFQVDAFTDRTFGGNPAGVCILEKWLPSDVLLKIAAENFLPETAFVVSSGHPGHFELKWFTPRIEMDLCGHATLATAHIIFNHLGYEGDNVSFDSNSGILKVKKNGNQLTLDFPARMPLPAMLPAIIEQGMGKQPREVLKSRDYVLVYDSEDVIKSIAPNRALIDQINLDPGGIIITAKGNDVDFVSRYFTPQSDTFEDPVTGSAHCSLIPFWSKRLGKKKMTALQLSERVGKLFCEDAGERVYISGGAMTYLEGNIFI